MPSLLTKGPAMPHLIYVLFRTKALEQMSVIRLVVGLKVQILRFGQNINVIRQRIKDFNKIWQIINKHH